MWNTFIVLLVFGFAICLVDACNDIGFNSVQAQDCFVDPNDGSKYGVYAAVYNPCADNEVLYLSLAYTAPNGQETRTVTSAQLGPASSAFSTTFTFDIPQTYFVNNAVISQTFQIDNSPPPASATRITRKVFSTTNSIVPRVETSTVLVQYTSTGTYTYTDTKVTGSTVTSSCTGGSPIVKTVTTTSLSTSTVYQGPVSIIYIAQTYTFTQSLRCTLAGGGVPSGYLPRLGEYELDACPSKYQIPTTYIKTGPTILTTITSSDAVGFPAAVYRTVTTTSIQPTQTVCNRPTSTSTTTATVTRVTRSSSTRTELQTITATYYVSVTTTRARSQC